MKIDVSNLKKEYSQIVNILKNDLKVEISSQCDLMIYTEKDETVFKLGAESKRFKFEYKRDFTVYLRNVIIYKKLVDYSESKFNSLSFMADCSRNAVLNVDSVKRLIRKLALSGYTEIQLYIEDIFEVDNEPYFGYFRGRYTKDELRELSEYGNLLGVEVVPAIQTLAHLNSIFRWRTYWDINDCFDILLADNEKTYRLIENVISTLSNTLISKKINIGMDEAHFLGYGKYSEQHGKVDRTEIMENHLKRVVDICSEYGFKPMMWSDMFYRLFQNGSYENGNSEVDNKSFKIPENLSLIYWNYYERNLDTYNKMILSHKAFNRNVIFAGGAIKWIGFAPDNRFSIHIAKTALKSCETNGIKSLMLTAWGDNGAECSIFSVLPSIVYYSAYNEGITDETGQEFNNLFEFVCGIPFKDFMSIDLPNRLTDENNPLNRNGSCKYLLYNDLFLGVMDSTVFDEMFIQYEKNYKILSCVSKKSDEFGYLFNTLSRLVKVLSIKFNLGVKIRRAYQNNDKKELKRIRNKVIKLKKLTEEFLVEFRKQWFKDNKPNGFDVQEIRIGGLIERIKSCENRINEYLKKGTEIPELNETLLDYFGNNDKFEKPLDCVDTAWHQASSVNNYF